MPAGVAFCATESIKVDFAGFGPAANPVVPVGPAVIPYVVTEDERAGKFAPAYYEGNLVFVMGIGMDRLLYLLFRLAETFPDTALDGSQVVAVLLAEPVEAVLYVLVELVIWIVWRGLYRHRFRHEPAAVCIKYPGSFVEIHVLFIKTRKSIKEIRVHLTNWGETI